jgi:hypothetical protein
LEHADRAKSASPQSSIRVEEALADSFGVRFMMLSNGIANIVAAAIVGGALVYNGAAGRADRNGAAGAISDTEFAELYARAVGDIRNDIVVNCGCCGDGAETGGSSEASIRPF